MEKNFYCPRNNFLFLIGLRHVRLPTAVVVKAPQHELGVRAVAGSNPSHFVGMKLKSIILAY